MTDAHALQEPDRRARDEQMIEDLYGQIFDLKDRSRAWFDWLLRGRVAFVLLVLGAFLLAVWAFGFIVGWALCR